MAASTERAFDVVLNGEMVLHNVGGVITGGWLYDHMQTIWLGEIPLFQGDNEITFVAEHNPFACIASVVVSR